MNDLRTSQYNRFAFFYFRYLIFVLKGKRRQRHRNCSKSNQFEEIKTKEKPNGELWMDDDNISNWYIQGKSCGSFFSVFELIWTTIICCWITLGFLVSKGTLAASFAIMFSVGHFEAKIFPYGSCFEMYLYTIYIGEISVISLWWHSLSDEVCNDKCLRRFSVNVSVDAKKVKSRYSTCSPDQI